jgi:nucleotide-binding universal stress UspA family protein
MLSVTLLPEAANRSAKRDDAAVVVGQLVVGHRSTPFGVSCQLSTVAPNFGELNTADALTRAETGAAIARSAGFTAEAQADLDAPTWEGIVEVADQIGAAVIVLGFRGLTGVREAFEGSVSHDVAEHAGRPVLIVPPPRG